MNRAHALGWGALCAGLTGGCAPARATAPDSGGVEDPCSPFVGFAARGAVWEYGVRTAAFEGWERSELIDLDRDTGFASVRTTGTRASPGVAITFDRTDTYTCVEGALLQHGYTANWEVGDGVGTTVLIAGVAFVWDSGVKVFDPALEAGDTWSIDDSYTMTSVFGAVTTGSSSYDMEVQPTEVLEVLGISVDTRPVGRMYFTEEPAPDSPLRGGRDTGVILESVWYAEDIGIVQRNGLVIESFTPGAGVDTD